LSGAASGPAWASALWLLLAAPGLLYAAGPIPPCSPASADHCGFDRPEDRAMLPGGRWLAVSQKSAVAPLLLLDTVSGERVPATLQNGSPRPGAAWSEGACAGPPAVFEPAGIAVQRVDGELWLAAINHAKPARIELFAIADTAGQPEPEWRDCVAVPEQYALNDVALATDGSLYATHMFTPATSAAAGARLRARFLAGEPTGHALRWRRGAGWSKVQGTELSFANGIALSHDGRWLAVSGTFDQAVLLVDLAGPERAPRAPSPRRVALGLQPDNLTPAGAAGFIVAGHTGVPVTGVDPCRPPDAAPCGFPFAVAQLSAPVGAAAPLLSTVLDDPGLRTPGASVAVRDGDRLFLGSAFGDRVSVRRVVGR
jgi:hypothetical protein